MRLSLQIQQLLSFVEDRMDMDWMDVIAHLQTQLIKDELGQDATDDENQRGLRYIISPSHYQYSICLCVLVC